MEFLYKKDSYDISWSFYHSMHSNLGFHKRFLTSYIFVRNFKDVWHSIFSLKMFAESIHWQGVSDRYGVANLINFN